METSKSTYKRLKNQFLDDGWNIAKRAMLLPGSMREAIFGYTDMRTVMRLYTASEAEELLNRYLGVDNGTER